MYGRFIPEIIRLIDALQIADSEKVATPANWMPKYPGIIPIPKTYEALEARVHEISQNQNGISWYLSYKNPLLPTEIDDKNN